MKIAKRIVAILLAVTLLFSLSACGSNTSSLVGEWEDIYDGTKLTLNKDNTATLGINTGTWTEQDNATIKLTYKSNSNNIEETFDIIECDGYSMLKSQKNGVINGESVIFSRTDYYPTEKVNEVKESIVKKTGEAVSTDIIEFTLNKAELGYYAASPLTSSSGKTDNVEKACSPCDAASSTLFKANKGRTLVCLDISLKNTDRDTLNTEDVISFNVKQNDKYSIVKGYDLNNPDGEYGLSWYRSPVSVNGGDYYTNDTSNELIRSDSTVRAKLVGVALFEAEDLNAPFELIVSLKNSSGEEEKFIYDIK